jgi:hypothetical protein
VHSERISCGRGLEERRDVLALGKFLRNFQVSCLAGGRAREPARRGKAPLDHRGGHAQSQRAASCLCCTSG